MEDFIAKMFIDLFPLSPALAILVYQNWQQSKRIRELERLFLEQFKPDDDEEKKSGSD